MLPSLTLTSRTLPSLSRLASQNNRMLCCSLVVCFYTMQRGSTSSTESPHTLRSLSRSMPTRRLTFDSSIGKQCPSLRLAGVLGHGEGQQFRSSWATLKRPAFFLFLEYKTPPSVTTHPTSDFQSSCCLLLSHHNGLSGIFWEPETS